MSNEEFIKGCQKIMDNGNYDGTFPPVDDDSDDEPTENVKVQPTKLDGGLDTGVAFMAAVLMTSKNPTIDINMRDKELMELLRKCVKRMEIKKSKDGKDEAHLQPKEQYVKHPNQPVVFWFSERKLPVYMDSSFLELIRHSERRYRGCE